MSWWAIVPPVIAGIVLLLLPGLVIAYSATARGVTAWGIAPVLSLTVYTVLGVGFGLIHVPWNPLSVGLGALVIVIVVALAARLWIRHSPSDAAYRDQLSVNRAAFIGTAIAFILIGVRLAVAFGHPDNISQTFDANFHLNGVRYILDTGDGNPLTFSGLQHAFTGVGSFYPNLWHLIASLVAGIGFSSVPVAANALSIVIAGLVWPLSCLVLVRQVLGARSAALIVTGVLSASFAAAPFLLLTFGVLYPNLLGLAVVPAGLAMLVLAVGWGKEEPLRRPLAWVAFVATLPGIALAHPNAFVSLAFIGLPLLIAAIARRIRGARARGDGPIAYVREAVLMLLVVAVYVAIFIVLRPSQAEASWGPTLGPLRASFNALVNAQLGPPAVVVSVLVLVGIVATFVRRRNRWLVASAVIIDALYAAVAHLPVGNWRYWTTGIWYSDVNRIIAMAPIVLVPLAVIGTLWLGELMFRLFTRLHFAGLDRGRPALVVLTVVGILVATGVQLGPSMERASASARAAYRLDASSPLLTRDDRDLLDRAAKEIPVGSVVAGDPWTGTALVWALADRRALVPHIYTAVSPDAMVIMKSLRDATPGSAVCRAIRAERVSYVLDFGSDGVFGKVNPRQYPGVHHLASSSAVTLVDSQGTAALYRVTAC